HIRSRFVSGSRSTARYGWVVPKRALSSTGFSSFCGVWTTTVRPSEAATRASSSSRGGPGPMASAPFSGAAAPGAARTARARLVSLRKSRRFIGWPPLSRIPYHRAHLRVLQVRDIVVRCAFRGLGAFGAQVDREAAARRGRVVGAAGVVGEAVVEA